MKAIIEFDLNDADDRMEHKRMLQATDLSCFIWDVEQLVFRPHRKHGYPDSVRGRKLNELIEAHPEVDLAIGLLEEMYYELKQGRNINDE